MAPHRPHFGFILEAIFTRNRNFEWKKGSKKWIKKRVPALTQMRDHDHAPRLPDSPPRVRAFLNKKQLSEQETSTAAHFWIHFRALFLEWAIFWFHVWRNVHVLMKSETKKTSHCKCFSLTVPFQRLVIWHALGQGPANFLYFLYFVYFSGKLNLLAMHTNCSLQPG